MILQVIAIVALAMYYENRYGKRIVNAKKVELVPQTPKKAEPRDYNDPITSEE